MHSHLHNAYPTERVTLPARWHLRSPTRCGMPRSPSAGTPASGMYRPARGTAGGTGHRNTAFPGKRESPRRHRRRIGVSTAGVRHHATRRSCHPAGWRAAAAAIPASTPARLRRAGRTSPARPGRRPGRDSPWRTRIASGAPERSQLDAGRGRLNRRPTRMEHHRFGVVTAFVPGHSRTNPIKQTKPRQGDTRFPATSVSRFPGTAGGIEFGDIKLASGLLIAASQDRRAPTPLGQHPPRTGGPACSVPAAIFVAPKRNRRSSTRPRPHFIGRVLPPFPYSIAGGYLLLRRFWNSANAGWKGE